MRSLLASVLDWVYPPRCELCLRIGRPAICDECLDAFVPLPNRVTTHVSGSSLDVTAALYSFEGRAAQAVKRLKYGRATALGPFMSEMIKESLDQLPLPAFDVIVPVPIHRSRRHARGFNQSDLLCESLSSPSDYKGMLTRTRSTKPQVGLSKSQRLMNLKGAFYASGSADDRRILLVDDVTTTGGTGIACAEALKAAGAAYVGLLAFCGESEPSRVG